MENIDIKFICFFSLLSIFISSEIIAQTSYIIDPKVSKMIILGTSSLHNWKVEVKDMECSVTLSEDGKSILGLQDAFFSCISTSIISDYKLMNNKTYEALKADEFPEIDFRMSDGKVLPGVDNRFTGSVRGYLTIAGETNEINIPYQGRFYESGHMDLEGKVNLMMSDYNIDPPTAFMGSLKTGDEVSVFYSFKFKEDVNVKTVSDLKLKRFFGD